MAKITLEKFLQKIRELPKEKNPIPILCKEFKLLRDNAITLKEAEEKINEQLFKGGNGNGNKAKNQ